MLVRVTLPLAAANFMNQAARMVMAIVGPVLAVELGLSAMELGVLAACLFAAYAAAQLPLGVALDAFGARRVQAVLMLLAALGFAMFALSPSFAGLAAARIVLGIGISAGLMAVIKAHADWFERGRVAYVTGIATAIGALGSALTTSPVQAILPTFGWRCVFWGLCLLALAVATWIFLSVPDKPRVPGPPRTLRGDIALSGRMLASRTFWRVGPAVATLSMFNFAYLGLWAGPWLRDVAGMDGPTRAGVLLLYTFAMVVGSVLTGSAASRANAAGFPSFLVPIVSLVGLVLLQAGLMLQPSQPSVVLALWLAIAVFGAAGPVGYVVMCQMFPPEQTGRVSTAVNTLTLGGAFLVQAAIGWILDCWPRTASGGWDPDGYSWALALTAAVQALAALVMATAHRRGRAISM
ncbi:nitrate/nitrite transporter [Reyranella sp. CPCC 100927]|uniref:MFS transporter n=1 Tax=Reyranella sp. CPCC 100927 TaxID=2599616 RepID=UPI0011B447BE|nr:MFS transporter [Reyranella sp. CPCC 100927]TWT10928.1 MFS transporter [Reyranella sp. CPCC 100927]